MSNKINLLNLNEQELTDFIVSLGKKKYIIKGLRITFWESLHPFLKPIKTPSF